MYLELQFMCDLLLIDAAVEIFTCLKRCCGAPSCRGVEIFLENQHKFLKLERVDRHQEKYHHEW
jgi:hypothetical protein